MDLSLDRVEQSEAKSLDPYERVFNGTRGAMLHHRNFLRRVWHPVVRTVKIDLDFHELRHTFASLLIQFTRADLLYVAGQLGHSSPSITLAVYAHEFAEARKGQGLHKEATLTRVMNANRSKTPAPSATAHELLPTPA